MRSAAVTSGCQSTPDGRTHELSEGRKAALVAVSSGLAHREGWPQVTSLSGGATLSTGVLSLRPPQADGHSGGIDPNPSSSIDP